MATDTCHCGHDRNDHWDTVSQGCMVATGCACTVFTPPKMADKPKPPDEVWPGVCITGVADDPDAMVVFIGGQRREYVPAVKLQTAQAERDEAQAEVTRLRESVKQHRQDMWGDKPERVLHELDRELYAALAAIGEVDIEYVRRCKRCGRHPDDCRRNEYCTRKQTDDV